MHHGIGHMVWGEVVRGQPPPPRIRDQPPPPPGSEVNHPLQVQRSTTSPPGSEVNHLPSLESEVNHLPLWDQRLTTSLLGLRGQPPPPPQVGGQPPPPGVRGQPPPPRTHTGTTVNGRAVRILLEYILAK